MALQCKRVLFCKRVAEVRAAYYGAFPKNERMPFPMMLGMSCLWNTEFFAFYDGDSFCGSIYLAVIGKQVFIMFFFVPDTLRSRGYGGQILAAVRARYPGKKIIVSIEPCDDAAIDDIRTRRKGFYRRNGYDETGYLMKLGGQVQEILINGGEFRKGAFIRFFLLYSNGVVIPKIWKKPESLPGV